MHPELEAWKAAGQWFDHLGFDIFYRVQGVGVDETRARAACAALKAQNVGCVVVRP